MEKLIFTNENCIGCNKCIRTCPVLLANNASERGSVSVDTEKCIACGACFDSCTHDARDYVDDTDRFFADLACHLLSQQALQTFSHNGTSLLLYDTKPPSSRTFFTFINIILICAL